MKNLYMLIAVTILSGTTQLAVAQGFSDMQPGSAPFSAHDLNSDGVITVEEFDSFRQERRSVRAAEGRPMRNATSAPSFADLDIDRDGNLSPEELAVGQKAQMQKRGGVRGQGMGRGTGVGRNMPSFSEFDLNNDGVLLEDEFIEARGERISERAKQGYQMRGLSNMLQFSAIDHDGDGKITPDEFSAGLALHRQQKLQ